MPPRQKTAPPPEPGTITATQMRRMHALLRDHGITGDSAVHSYIALALTEHGQEPVESRSELSATAAALIIADLENAEVAEVHTASAAQLRKLRAPFDDEAIGHLPRSTCRDCSDSNQGRRGTCGQHPQQATCDVCGNYHNTQRTMHITYVGHADVTARLLEVDPAWTWEPFTVEQLNAIPPEMRKGLWINLTVLGVTRPGFGDAEGGKGPKEAIGDALRNAAMRFGVALDLWAKGDREWSKAEKVGTDQHPDVAQPRQPQHDPPPAPYAGPTTPELLAMIDGHAERAGITRDQITAKWREQHGGMALESLDTLDPQFLAPLEQQIADYLIANPPLTGDRDE